MKRTLNSNGPACVENKKQRVINRLENLSNEVFYEIFDYLDGCDLLTAFSNLNHRFQTLIHHSSVLLKLTHDNRKSIPMKRYCKEVILPNKHRLLALHAVPDGDHGLCFDCSIFDRSFERLESLTLTQLTTDQLPINCIYLIQLPRLYSLEVYLKSKSTDYRAFAMIYREILCLPVLKYLKFFSPLKWIEDQTTVVIPSIMTPEPSSIEDLSIRQIISPSNVLSVLKYTPQLHRLHCQTLTQFNETIHQLNKPNLACLKQISIEDCSIPFSRFEILMHSIGEQLEILKFRPHRDMNYLKSDRLERMIKKDLPRLKVFNMLCDSIPRTLIDSNDNLITLFYSQFWIDRGWFPSVLLNQSMVKIHIRPYKKQWFDGHRDHWEHPPEKSYCFFHMDFSSRHLNQSDSSLIRNAKHFCSKVPFIHLSLKSERSFKCLFETTDDVLNVDCLDLESTDIIDFGSLSRVTSMNQLLFTKKNRITKLKLKSITKIEEIEHIINLFPRMEYLELDIQSDTSNVVTILKLLLSNHFMRIPNLRSVCFDGVKVDRLILDKLRQVVDYESLIENYSLRCIKNRIFIQWS